MEEKDREGRTLEIEPHTCDRLDRWLSRRLSSEGISRSRVKEMILSGEVEVEGVDSPRPSLRLRGGERIRIRIAPSPTLGPPQGIKGIRGDVEVVWRDEDVAVIDKPPHLPVHPALSCTGPTLVHHLLAHFPSLSGMDRERPGIVHRLDKDTSGLMLIALNSHTQEILKEFFKARRIKKTYLALVWGRPPQGEGRIEVPIARDPHVRTRMCVSPKGRDAITLYRVLEYFEREDISLVEVRILTGRTHQIRVHMGYLGHPVVGDQVYGGNRNSCSSPILPLLIKRQMLHSWSLEFPHPRKHRTLRFTSPVPLDFYRVLLQLLSRPLVVGITGSVGAGKSNLSRGLCADRGCSLWDADAVVARLYRRGEAGWEMIRRTFGSDFLDQDRGEVDRKKLLASMRKHPPFYEQLLKVIHPLVEGELVDFLKKNQYKRLLVCEVPLLFEARWHGPARIFDVVVLVFCEDEERYQRLSVLRGWSKEQISWIDSWQLPQREKVRMADIIVDNSGDKASLEKKVSSLREILRSLRRKRLMQEIERLKRSCIIQG